MMKKLETVCRTFLQTRGTNASKKALLSWDKVCSPKKIAGGYNVIDKTGICKLLWNLYKKKDKLWVQWIHLYYGKKQKVWETNPSNALWIVQKISRGRYEGTGRMELLLYQEVVQRHARTISKSIVEDINVQQFRGSKVDLCAKSSSAKQTPYKKVTGSIWSKLLHWQGITRSSMEWQREVQWDKDKSTGNNAKARVYRLTLVCAVHHIWNERNKRLFQEEQKTMEVIVRQIIQEVANKGSRIRKLEKTMEEMNFYP
ncbi:uncharacterized protein LOC107813653 [Nicotiana tabacum]|uniref:Uncharacterized protein LOC107813653 n=1 Tax=Nicotiana tabacum TaxID=4097 RepID=A0A1S4BZU1_TOBAC